MGGGSGGGGHEFCDYSRCPNYGPTVGRTVNGDPGRRLQEKSQKKGEGLTTKIPALAKDATNGAGHTRSKGLTTRNKN